MFMVAERCLPPTQYELVLCFLKLNQKEQNKIFVNGEVQVNVSPLKKTSL